jgi:hypothetical protein
MGVAFGLMAIVAALVHWPWLAVVAGLLAIASDVHGIATGALRGCVVPVASWFAGAVVGGSILMAMGLDELAGALGGVALAAMIWDLIGYAFLALVSRSRA